MSLEAALAANSHRRSSMLSEELPISEPALDFNGTSPESLPVNPGVIGIPRFTAPLTAHHRRFESCGQVGLRFSQMSTITLISTIHEEIGWCNADALHAILERARPEVIFMEIPPLSFQRVFEEEENLESRAVKRYLQAHRAEVVPIDLMEASSEIVAESQRLCRELRARSSDYCQIMNAHQQHTHEHGFAYLNSKYCVEIWSKADVATRETLEIIANAELSRGYKYWKDVNEHREQEMLKSIHRYAEANSFNTGMFLLGAAHRRAIMDKAASLTSSASVAIDWNFGEYEGLIDGWRADAAAK